MCNCYCKLLSLVRLLKRGSLLVTVSLAKEDSLFFFIGGLLFCSCILKNRGSKLSQNRGTDREWLTLWFRFSVWLSFLSRNIGTCFFGVGV